MTYFLINRSPRASLDGKVAEEVLTNNKIDYFGLRVFGCLVYVHVSNDKRSKLDPKSRQCILYIYKKGVKGFKLWDLKENKIVISKDAFFL
jgi:hypothetical protein